MLSTGLGVVDVSWIREPEGEAGICAATAAAASCRDAAAQVLHHRIRPFGHDSCSRSAERVPLQTETPVGQDEGA